MASVAKTRVAKADADDANMATVTVGELRSDFRSVEAKLARGMRVQVTRRGAVVAEVLLPNEAAKSEQAFDFRAFVPEMKARLHATWGEEPIDIDTTALISEGRDRDLLP